MASVNKVILIGRLGADPEIRETTRGAKVANMSLATNQHWVDHQSGESRKRTEWHRVVMWGRQAELADEYLKKGSPVYVEGALQTREWTDDGGITRTTTEVKAQRMQFLDRGAGSVTQETTEPTRNDDPVEQ